MSRGHQLQRGLALKSPWSLIYCLLYEEPPPPPKQKQILFLIGHKGNIGIISVAYICFGVLKQVVAVQYLGDLKVNLWDCKGILLPQKGPRVPTLPLRACQP